MSDLDIIEEGSHLNRGMHEAYVLTEVFTAQLQLRADADRELAESLGIVVSGKSGSHRISLGLCKVGSSEVPASECLAAEKLCQTTNRRSCEVLPRECLYPR